MPAPFAWVEIAGMGYHMAKYPVTNAQYAVFINEGGYQEEKWWTKQGWKARKSENWTAPRYWREPRWNKSDHPVVGVSWYEAVAFCLWLSDRTSEKIMLPTEDQWQYAAQGDDQRTYPWGNKWDCRRCNSSVKPCLSNTTTLVQQYEGKDKGNSPFGVVDMAGNVWEWCVTDLKTKLIDIELNSNCRVLRGGAWDGDNANDYRCDYRGGYDPLQAYNDGGFRLSFSSSLF
ncbi:MAG: formylglycine-generating enzyme family protein [Anaerolineae bacterium]|jgi:formylglycine-generating enzyme required for sulfatase activity|nr:formylglycine-generating enzyme family protein [Anaerolineae bacterium]